MVTIADKLFACNVKSKLKEDPLDSRRACVCFKFQATVTENAQEYLSTDRNS